MSFCLGRTARSATPSQRVCVILQRLFFPDALTRHERQCVTSCGVIETYNVGHSPRAPLETTNANLIHPTRNAARTLGARAQPLSTPTSAGASSARSIPRMTRIAQRRGASSRRRWTVRLRISDTSHSEPAGRILLRLAYEGACRAAGTQGHPNARGGSGAAD